jgi:flagellin FlaB
MGLNKKFVKMKNDKRAEMGVGTMIVFIAMVLVAAVAASVLISTANTVREQAQSTGDQAINNVASGFVVQDVVGTINAGKPEITDVTIYMRLAAGSPNVNMDNVMISVTTSDSSDYLNKSDAAADGVSYGFDKTLDVQNFQDNVLGQGDLAEVTVTGLTIGFNQMVVIKIIPAYGQMCLITFTTPEQYSSQYITLA